MLKKTFFVIAIPHFWGQLKNPLFLSLRAIPQFAEERGNLLPSVIARVVPRSVPPLAGWQSVFLR